MRAVLENLARVVAVRTEHSAAKGQYCPVRPRQASLGSILYGTRTKPVYFEFASFRDQRYTAYGNGPYGKIRTE